MATMIAEKSLEEKTGSFIAEKPHTFFREKNKNGKYICIKTNDKKRIYHSTMEIIGLLREIKNYKGVVYATINEVKVEYLPKDWREIKKLLSDARHVFGNGYHK